MKKIIRKVLNNRVCSIKKFFTLLTAAAVVATTYNIFAIGGCPNGEEYRYLFNAVIALISINVINVIAAISTRLLYFNGLLKRKNVVKFFFE